MTFFKRRKREPAEEWPEGHTFRNLYDPELMVLYNAWVNLMSDIENLRERYHPRLAAAGLAHSMQDAEISVTRVVRTIGKYTVGDLDYREGYKLMAQSLQVRKRLLHAAESATGCTINSFRFPDDVDPQVIFHEAVRKSLLEESA